MPRRGNLFLLLPLANYLLYALLLVILLCSDKAAQIVRIICAAGVT